MHKHWLNVYHLIQASEVCQFIPSHHALFSVLLSVITESSSQANLSFIQWVCDEVTVFLSSCMLLRSFCCGWLHHRSGTSEDIRSSSCAAPLCCSPTSTAFESHQEFCWITNEHVMLSRLFCVSVRPDSWRRKKMNWNIWNSFTRSNYIWWRRRCVMHKHKHASSQTIFRFEAWIWPIYEPFFIARNKTCQF